MCSLLKTPQQPSLDSFFWEHFIFEFFYNIVHNKLPNPTNYIICFRIFRFHPSLELNSQIFGSGNSQRAKHMFYKTYSLFFYLFYYDILFWLLFLKRSGGMLLGFSYHSTFLFLLSCAMEYLLELQAHHKQSKTHKQKFKCFETLI